MPMSPENCADKMRQADEQEALAKQHEERAQELLDQSDEEWEKYEDALAELDEINEQLARIEELEQRQTELVTEIAAAREVQTTAEEALATAEEDRDRKQWLYEVTEAEREAVLDEIEDIEGDMEEAQGLLDDLDIDDPQHAYWQQRYDDLEVRLIDIQAELAIVEEDLAGYEAEYYAAESDVADKASEVADAKAEVERLEEEKAEVDADLATIDAIQSDGSKARLESDRDAAEFNAKARGEDAEREQQLADDAWDRFYELVDDLEEHCEYLYEEEEAPAP